MAQVSREGFERNRTYNYVRRTPEQLDAGRHIGEEPRGLLGSAWDNLWGGMEGMVGGLADTAGTVLKAQYAEGRASRPAGLFGGFLVDRAIDLNQSAAENARRSGVRNEYSDMGILDRLTSPSYLFDPRGLTAEVSNMTGSMIPFMLMSAAMPEFGAAGVAGLIGRGLSRIGANKIAGLFEPGGAVTGFLRDGFRWAPTGVADAMSNAGEVAEEMRRQGYTNTQIADRIGSAMSYELPYDVVSQGLFGGFLGGKGVRKFAEGGGIGRNIAANTALGGFEALNEAGQEFVQTQAVEQALGKPVGTFMNPTDEERRAFDAAFIGTLPMVAAGGARNVTKNWLRGKAESAQSELQSSAHVKTSGDENIDSLIAQAAEKYGVPVNLLHSVAQTESGYNQGAKSEAGAIGMMQLMPDTAAGLGVDPNDLAGNIEGGAKYLREMLDTFDGNVEKAVAAYNAGPNAVKKNGGIPPFEETQDYVRKVMGGLDGYDASVPQRMRSLLEDATQYLGMTMDNGENGCVEAVTKIGAKSCPFLAQELSNGVVNVDRLVADAGNNVIPFDPNQLEEGDVIVYGDESDPQRHVVLYDGKGGYIGNSTEQNKVVQGADYNAMGAWAPTKIIKTGAQFDGAHSAAPVMPDFTGLIADETNIKETQEAIQKLIDTDTMTPEQHAAILQAAEMARDTPIGSGTDPAAEAESVNEWQRLIDRKDAKGIFEKDPKRIVQHLQRLEKTQKMQRTRAAIENQQQIEATNQALATVQQAQSAQSAQTVPTQGDASVQQIVPEQTAQLVTDGQISPTIPQAGDMQGTNAAQMSAPIQPENVMQNPQMVQGTDGQVVPQNNHAENVFDAPVPQNAGNSAVSTPSEALAAGIAQGTTDTQPMPQPMETQANMDDVQQAILQREVPLLSIPAYVQARQSGDLNTAAQIAQQAGANDVAQLYGMLLARRNGQAANVTPYAPQQKTPQAAAVPVKAPVPVVGVRPNVPVKLPDKIEARRALGISLNKFMTDNNLQFAQSGRLDLVAGRGQAIRAADKKITAWEEKRAAQEAQAAQSGAVNTAQTAQEGAQGTQNTVQDRMLAQHSAEPQNGSKTVREKSAQNQGNKKAADKGGVVVAGDEFGAYKNIKELREKALQYYKEHLQGTSVENALLGEINIDDVGLVEFTGSGKRELKNSSAKEEKLLLVKHLPELIRDATDISGKKSSKENHPGEYFYYLHTAAEINGQTTPVEITLVKRNNGAIQYYNHTLPTLEKSNKNEGASVSTEPESLNEPSASPSIHAPSSTSTISSEAEESKEKSLNDNEREAVKGLSADAKNVYQLVRDKLAGMKNKKVARAASAGAVLLARHADIIARKVRAALGTPFTAMDYYNEWVALRYGGEESGFTQAAMKKSDATSLSEFSRQMRTPEAGSGSRKKTFLRITAPSGAFVDVAQDDMIHMHNHHPEMTDEDFSIIQENMEKFLRVHQDKTGKGDYGGETVLCKIKTPRGVAGVSYELLPTGRIFLKTAFFDNENGIDNWIAKNGTSKDLMYADTEKRGNAASMLTGHPSRTADAADSLTPSVAQPLSLFMIQERIGIVNGEKFNQSAWHGSPHDFDSFDLGAIGTGEGAQVHGWGLYFAQDRKVSEEYKEWLAGKHISYDGKPISAYTGDIRQALTALEKRIQPNFTEDIPTQIIAYRNELAQNVRRARVLLSAIDVELAKDEDSPPATLAALRKDASARIREIIDSAPPLRNGRRRKVADVMQYLRNEQERYRMFIRNAEVIVQQLQHIDSSKVGAGKGKLFEVEIPDNDVLLDEQKPFRKQPAFVQERLEKLFEQMPEDDLIEIGAEYSINLASLYEYKEEARDDEKALANYEALYATVVRADSIARHMLRGMSDGELIYKAIGELLRKGGQEGKPEQISRKLNEYGIKGITYVGSRDGRCYVIFDDKAIQIIEKFNQQMNEIIKGTTQDVRDGQRIVSLFEEADESTFLHEMGHLFLLDLERLADMSPTSAQELQTVKKWAAWSEGQAEEYKGAPFAAEFAKLDADIRTALKKGDEKTANELKRQWEHERFARGFEMYLKHGEAPTKGLRAVFAKFRAFLQRVYQAFTGTGGRATAEVEAVMARMISIEDSSDLSAYPQGKKTNVYTDSGKKIPVQYRVVSADDLIASHDAGALEINPGYPAALQPRDRERVMMRQQVTRMSNTLRPEDLADGRNLNQGAPLIRNDGVVLNGNGRTIAIQRAQVRNKERATAYRDYLIENAATFGLSKEEVESVKNPVLVREVQGDISDVLMQDIIGSTTGGARMGASEAAQQDAEKITYAMLDAYVPNDKGDLTTAANRNFVAGILHKVVGNGEMNAYLDKDGHVNADGIQRVKRALFACAYGDDELVAKMSESTDDDIRNVSNGMMAAAPMMARLSVKKGVSYVKELQDAIGAAVKQLDALRASGESVKDYLGAQSMFAEYEDSDEMRFILGFLDENKRSGKRIATFFSRVATTLDKMETPSGNELFDAETPSLMDVLEGARGYAENGGQEGLFGEETESVSVAESIKQGAQAVERVLSGHQDVPNAMYRDETGGIDFVYGEAGNPAKKYAGGYGIAHILAKHGQEAVDMIPTVIAKGKAIQKYNDRIHFNFGDYTAVVRLDFDGKKKTWLVTNFEKYANKKDSPSAEDFARSADKSNGARSTVGGNLSSVSTIAQEGAEGKQESTLENILQLAPALKKAALEYGAKDERGKVTFADEDRKQEFLKVAKALLSAGERKFSKAWHGSPHDFDGFDLGAIGTGEGAQTHGWGLYFAQNREVSEWYKDVLGEVQQAIIHAGDKKTYAMHPDGYRVERNSGKPLKEGSSIEIALSAFEDSNANVKQAIRETEEYLERMERIKDTDVRERNKDLIREALRILQEEADTWNLEKKKSSLFLVEIPDDDVLLDEQKKLVDQPKIVALLEKYAEKIGDWSFTLEEVPDYTGRDFYKYISDVEGGDKAASEYLNSAGIKGITYVGSRDGRCYVIFDDKAIKILEKFSARRQEALQEMLDGIRLIPPTRVSPRKRVLVDWGREMGVPVVFFKGDPSLHGFHQDGVTFLNVDSEITPQWTFWHEAMHWMKANNPDIYSDLVQEIRGAEGFTKKQLDAYRNEIGAPNMSDADVIEEMVADALPDARRRVPILQDIGKRDTGLIQRLVAWIHDVMRRFHDHFYTPKGGLTSLQRRAMVRAFGNLVLSIRDADGKPIFRVGYEGARIILHDKSPLPEVKYSQSNKAMRWIAEHPFKYDESRTMDENIQRAERLAQEYLDTFGTTDQINTPARQQLRKQIADKLYGNGAKKKEGKVWLVLGVPASGKSTFSDPLVEREGALLIDSDEAKKLLPEFSNGLLAGAVHEESANIAETVFSRAMTNYDNMVLPLVGKTMPKLQEKIDKLKEVGYEVNLIYVDLPVEKAIERTKARFRHTGRLVPPNYLRKVGLKPKENYDKLKVTKEVDSYEAWDSDVARGSHPRLIESAARPKQKASSSGLGGRGQHTRSLDEGGGRGNSSEKSRRSALSNNNENRSDNRGGFSMPKFSTNTQESCKGNFKWLTGAIRRFVGVAPADNLELPGRPTREVILSPQELERRVKERWIQEKNIISQEKQPDGKIKVTYYPDTHDVGYADWVKSVRQVAKRNPFVQALYKRARAAMKKQEHLRNEFGKTLKTFADLVKNPEDLKTVSTILWLGDAKGKVYTDAELRSMGASENAIKAYKLVREVLERAYKMLNDARMQVQTRSQTMAVESVETFKKNHWIKNEDVISVQPHRGGQVLLTWRGGKTYDTKDKVITAEALELMKKDDDIIVTRATPLSPTQYGEGMYEVDYVERIRPIHRLTGYMPHFFHEWMVYEKYQDPNTGQTRYTTIGSGRTMNEAVKIGNEKAAKNKDKQYVLRPKGFDLGVENSVVIGDMDFAQMTKKLAENTEMTLTDARTFLQEDVGVSLKSRHRFLGNAMKRKGADGFDKDVMWVLAHYLNSTARYVAMEEFKPWAISMYERFFGAFDRKPPNLTAKYCQDLINDVNGNPRGVEVWLNDLINKTWLGKHVADSFGDRVALAINGELSTWNAITKLGLFNIASAAVNFSQFINIGAALNDYGYAAQGLKRALNPSALDEKIIEASGLLDDINMADDNGGYTQRRGGKVRGIYSGVKKGGEWTLIPFQKADTLMRKAAVLGAYYQGIEQKGMKTAPGDELSAEALAYAQEINDDANFDYSSANAPNAFRLGSVVTQQLFQFQKYPIMQFEFMYNIMRNGTRGQKVRMFMPYVIFCGIGASIPFGSLFNQLFSFLFGLATGDDEDIAQDIKAEVLRWAGKDPVKKAIAETALYGVLAPTFGLDISGRIGMSNAFGGEFYGAQKPESVAGVIGQQLGGPAANSIYNMLHQFHEGNPIEAMKAVSPAFGNALQAAFGVSRTTRHRVNARYDTAYDKIAHALGFRSVDESNNAFIMNYEYEQKSKLTRTKQEAIQDYLDDPSDANRRTINALGITDKQIKEARIQQERTALERATEGRPNTSGKHGASRKRKEEAKRETLYDTLEDE
jgi:hypothetical protein